MSGKLLAFKCCFWCTGVRSVCIYRCGPVTLLSLNLCLLNLVFASLLSCLQVSRPKDGGVAPPRDTWRIMIEWCVLSLPLSRRGTRSSRSPTYGLAPVSAELPIVESSRALDVSVRAWLGAWLSSVRYRDIRGVYSRLLWSCYPISRSAVQLALAAAVIVVVIGPVRA
jgi:hypothetical protein